MTKISTRVADQNLVELAKQNYEKKQVSKIPGVLVNLPSAGQVYPSTNVCHEGVLEMRYMTAFDEDILTNASYIREKVLWDKLLEALVITPGFNVKTLIEADKEWLIISARIHGYGAEYPVTVKDPDGNILNRVVQLNKLMPPPCELQSDENGEFEYDIDENWKLKYRYLPASVLNNIPEDAAISYFLEQSVREVNGNRDPHFIHNFLKLQMSPIESRTFRKHIQQTTPVVNLSYEFIYTTKEGKEEAFHSGFQLGPDFFWI